MTINKDIILFSNNPYTKYRKFGFYALAHFGFMVINVTLAPSKKALARHEEHMKLDKESVEKRAEQTKISSIEPTPSRVLVPFLSVFDNLREINWQELLRTNNVRENFRESPVYHTIVVVAISCISIGFLLYPRRQVRTITLLPGCQRVRLSFFSPFAIKEPPTLELPIKNISCMSGRDPTKNYSILKLKGYPMYHLIDLKEGKFHEPALFDEHLAFTRPWAVKS